MIHKMTVTPLLQTGNAHKVFCTCGIYHFYTETDPAKKSRVRSEMISHVANANKRNINV